MAAELSSFPSGMFISKRKKQEEKNMAINIESIKKCAEDAKAILAKVETVEDVISLRRIGISENEVYSIDIGDGLTDEFDLHELEPDTKVYAIMLREYSNGTCCIQHPCYAPAFGRDPFYFDVYDADAEAVILEDQHIDTVEEHYQDICSQLTEALELVASLAPKCIDLRTQWNYFAHIRDAYEIAATAEYIEENYKVTRDEAFEYAEKVHERMDAEQEDLELESKMIKETMTGVEKGYK